ncbi:MAG: Fe-S cluster assembly protein SufD [Chloroflexi bacterium]|nr:Fe-S cluster assembly protein SufD [Chloroflexota bacterium]
MTHGTVLVTGLSRQAVEELSERYQEPDWLLKRRLEAWRLFEEAPMPSPLDEEWKHTDASRLSLDGLLPVAPPRGTIDGVGEFPPELRSIWDEREQVAGRLVQHDSTVVYRALDEAVARQGVVVTDLHTAAREQPEIVREHLLSLVTPAEWKYLGLHGALWSGGCLVYVPSGVEVELPIEYAVGLTTPNVGLFPHLLIVAEPNSSVTVIQESTSPALDGLTVVSGAVEVIARDGAQVRFVDVQRWGANVQGFSTMRASLAKSASFQPTLIGLGGAITKLRLEVLLNEAGASAELLGLFFGDNDQRFDYHTRQDHIAPHTESDLLFKATLADRAALAWNGVVDVRKTASESAANQTSRNLLLSDKASASPTPILEISAYDVLRCSHGATVGPVDKDQIFYLQSRGIPAEEAERMLVDGFFAEVLDRVPSEGLQRRVHAILASKLGW